MNIIKNTEIYCGSIAAGHYDYKTRFKEIDTINNIKTYNVIKIVLLSAIQQ